ncbi:type IV secretion system protein [Blastomonas sp.]|uniref:type IV secretion system protein n=1 Tax=Blastomonas sp. TaxID=1909299 RepID=UPI0035942D99
MNPDFCTPASSEGLVASLLANTDCQAFGLVERGYAAMAEPGGPVAAALTSMMVIAVALFGYRLLLGRGLILSDTIGLAIKIGVVLLVATSWEAWQTLAYETFARAPARIAAQLLSGIGAPDPLESLQTALNNLEAASVGYRTRAGIASPLVGGPAAAAMVLNVSALLLALSIVGIMVAVRVVLALLLAIAPVMAGFLLFDATRGMAQAWLGAMATAAIVPLFVLILASVELAIIGPIIGRLLAEQAAGTFETATVMPVGLVTVVFAIASVFALKSAGRIARGIRLPGDRSNARVSDPQVTLVTTADDRGAVLATQSSAARIAQALDVSARRDAPAAIVGARGAAAALATTTSRESNSTAQGRAGDGAVIVAPRRLSGPRLRGPARSSRAASRRDA